MLPSPSADSNDTASIGNSISIYIHAVQQAKQQFTEAETTWSEVKRQRDLAQERIVTWMKENRHAAVCCLPPVDRNSKATRYLLLQYQNRHNPVRERTVQQAFEALEGKSIHDVLAAAAIVPTFRCSKASPESPHIKNVRTTRSGCNTSLTLQDALFNIVIAQLNQLTLVSKAVLRVADKCRRELPEGDISTAPEEVLQAIQSYPVLLEQASTAQIRRPKKACRVDRPVH